MLSMLSRLVGALTFGVLFTSTTAVAHEFWISPQDYTVDPGGQLNADIRVGTGFKGGAMVFLPQRFRRFDIVAEEGVAPVASRLGDKPALQMQAPEQEGLLIIVHETTDSRLTYRDPAKFVAFVEEKGLGGVLERHRQRGLPEEGFDELYSRYAKSLIAVGDGAGQDREVGLTTEIVALTNPYTGPEGGSFAAKVLYEGQPRPGVQVDIFRRAVDDEITLTQLRTDDQGVVRFDLVPGAEYLVDSVVMRELQPTVEGDPVWESLWASLTFRAAGGE